MSASTRKLLVALLVIVLVAYAAFFNYVWAAMNKTPEQFGKVMSGLPTVAYFLVPFETLWMHARAGHLQVGDPAPDFTLHKLDKDNLDQVGTVQLSALSAQQPVVLVFGSYT